MSSIMKSLLFLLSLWTALPAFAFIPRASYITKKVVEEHSKAPLQIERTAHFRVGSQSLSLRESWIIDGEQSLKVTVRSAHQVIFQALFHNANRYEAGKETTNWPSDFFEHHLVQRNPRKWLDTLVKEGFLNKSALEVRPIKDLKTYQWVGDSSVRLSRVQGTIAFAFGTKDSAGSPGGTPINAPGIWIDQMDFSLLRLTTSAGSDIRFGKVLQGPKSSAYPHEVQINWEGKSAQIQTHNIETLKSVGKNFDPDTLSKARWDLVPESPAKELALAFYSRFR